MDFYVAGFWLLLTALSVLAWAWRDPLFAGSATIEQPELVVAGLLWLAAVLSAALRPSLATRFAFDEPALFIIDFGLFAGLTLVGVRSGKWWILCTAALQLISASAHIAPLVTPVMWRLGYQVMEEASSYPALALLGWGIVRHRLARKQNERSKTFSDNPSMQTPIPPG